MATVTAAELTALADTLKQAAADVAKTAAGIDRHIAAEGKKIGDERGVQYAKTAKEQIAEVEKTAAVEIQRRDDIIEELRVQIGHLERHARTGFALEKRIRELVNVANQRGEGVPAQVLLQAIAEAQTAGRQDPNQPAPAPVRIDKEN